ncbi:hypothetical protein QLQ12_15235 [Actinoplanes sp. NEAU-A12]|uniref:Uncharacterized protein n=1 Tax=Actinoplanes sandaracinus TaxID=3045177 RepID=A0ABT6WJP6_9ACTN|nr:hypothetical protein [Actinoplanes sandaracinus]MDI6099953.1 hypothetical protein [Actinoplanes sandaracinus]
MTLLTAAATIYAVLAAVDGDLIGALGLGAGAVFLGHLIGLCVRMWWRPRRRNASPEPAAGGVLFRYSGWTYYWAASFLVLMVLALLLGGLSFWSAGDGPVSIVVAVLASAAALLFSWALVRLFYGGLGWLRLTPDGLEHHGPGFTHRLPWSSVTDVAAAKAGESPLILVLPTASDTVDVTFALPTRVKARKDLLLPSMAIRGMWLADDPAVVYHTLCHYHVNPEHRVELSTGAAIDRVRQRRFLLR